MHNTASEPKDRLNDFAFGLSFFNEHSRADNLSDFTEELKRYLASKYPFLAEDRIDNIVKGIQEIMVKPSGVRVHPVEKAAGLSAVVIG